MENELKSAISESLPDEGVKVESPTTPDAPVETPTPKVEQQQPFHEHPRFKELIEEKNQAKAEAQRAQQQLYDLVNKLQQPQTQADPYASLTPEEKIFYQSLDKRIQTAIEDRVGKEREVFQREIMQTKANQAAMMYERFLKEHPDIKPNSPEEDAVATKFRQGYSLEDAYQLVVTPQKMKMYETEMEKLKRLSQQKQVEKKIAANQETVNVAATSPVFTSKMSTREKIAAFVDEFTKGS